MNTSDYLQGMNDAKEGLQAEVGASDDYYAGYGYYYSDEQAITAKNIDQDKQMSIFL